LPLPGTMGRAPSHLPWLALVHSRISSDGQSLPELATCNGFTEEWGVCPGLPPCFQPVHCKFGEWEEWVYGGGCAGICSRSRQVKEFSDEYGRACSGALEKSKDCTTDPNYVSSCYNGAAQGNLFDESACAWQQWSEWSACSRNCGGGEKGRSRGIARQPKYGGAPCTPEVTDEVTPCNTQTCFACIDGQWGPWQPWQACSATCGSGLQWRERAFDVQANQCGQPATGSPRDFRPCHGGFADEDPRCTADVSSRGCMLGDWENWGLCEAQCDIGRRSRRRPFLSDNVKHYTVDLENQVFKLQSGNDLVEHEKNLLILNVTAINQKLLRLQEHDRSVTANLNREIANKDKLQANVSLAEWQQKQLEMTIVVLKQEKNALRAKADELSLALHDMPTPVDNSREGDQATNLTAVALLTFAAAVGVTCACCGIGCQRRRRRHFTESADPPDTASVASNADANLKDVEDQPWRPVPVLDEYYGSQDGACKNDGFE